MCHRQFSRAAANTTLQGKFGSHSETALFLCVSPTLKSSDWECAFEAALPITSPHFGLCHRVASKCMNRIPFQ